MTCRACDDRSRCRETFTCVFCRRHLNACAHRVGGLDGCEREQGLMQALVDIAHGIEAVLAGRGEPELTMRERVAIAAMLTTAWQRAGAAEALRCAFTFLEASRGLGAPCPPPRTDD